MRPVYHTPPPDGGGVWFFREAMIYFNGDGCGLIGIGMRES